MELWKKVRIPLDKARELMEARIRGGELEEPAAQEAEAQAGGEGGEPKRLKTLPWRKILALVMIAVGLIGTAYAAATIISQWVLVGQGPIVEGQPFEITVNQTFTQFELYKNYSFQIAVKNNDVDSHTVHPFFNISLTSGDGTINYDDFRLFCNGTQASLGDDQNKFVSVRVPVNSALDPGDSAKYVCSLKFVDEGLVDNQVKVEVALES